MDYLCESEASFLCQSSFLIWCWIPDIFKLQDIGNLTKFLSNLPQGGFLLPVMFVHILQGVPRLLLEKVQMSS